MHKKIVLGGPQREREIFFMHTNLKFNNPNPYRCDYLMMAHLCLVCMRYAHFYAARTNRNYGSDLLLYYAYTANLQANKGTR